MSALRNKVCAIIETWGWVKLQQKKPGKLPGVLRCSLVVYRMCSADRICNLRGMADVSNAGQTQPAAGSTADHHGWPSNTQGDERNRYRHSLCWSEYLLCRVSALTWPLLLESGANKAETQATVMAVGKESPFFRPRSLCLWTAAPLQGWKTNRVGYEWQEITDPWYSWPSQP